MTSIQKWEPKAGLAVLEKQYGSITASERETQVRTLGVLLDKGFDPALHLMVYQGRLAVKIEGMYWWRDGDTRFRRMKSHPIDPALKAAYGCNEDEIGVITEIFLKGETEPICEGFGKASMRAYTYKKNESPWDHPDRKRNPIDAEHTYRMAEKRSENQAIKKFRPLGIEIETPEEMSDTVEGEARVVESAGTEAPEDWDVEWDVEAAKTAPPAKPAPGAGPAAPAKPAEAPQTGKAAPVKDEQTTRAEAIAKSLKWDAKRFATEFEKRAATTWREASPLTKAAVMDEMERATPKQEAQS